MTNTPTGGPPQRERPLLADPDLTLPQHEVLSETGREREELGLPTAPAEAGAAPPPPPPPPPPPAGIADKAAAATGEAVEGAKQVAGTAAEQGAQVVGTATDQAKEVAGAATDEAKQLAQDAAQQARNLVDDARTELRSQVTAQTDRLAGSLREVSSQLRSMAESDSAQQGIAVELVRDAAERSNQFAIKVQEGGIETLLEDARRFARNRPGLFLIGAIGAGFAVGRIVRNVDTSEIVDAAKEAATGGDQQVLGSGSAQLSGSNTVAGSVPRLGA